MIESASIDKQSHARKACGSIGELAQLEEALQSALVFAEHHPNTLILVTADHSHTLTISGYPRRGNPILGKVETAPGVPMLDREGRPYTTLGYANGQGYRDALPDLTEVDTEDPSFKQVAGVPLFAETHAGEDKRRRELAETRNQAESLIHASESTLADLGDEVRLQDERT